MKLKPLADRVVIKAVEVEEGDKERPCADLERPGEAPNGRSCGGRPWRRGGWQRSIHVCQRGRPGYLFKYAGTEVKLDGEEFTVVKQADILAIVE